MPYPPLPPSESGESAASDAVQRLGEYQEELRRQRRALREARDLARPVQLLQHMRRGERIAEVNTLFCLSLNVAPPLLPYVQSWIQKKQTCGSSTHKRGDDCRLSASGSMLVG